jgi:RNA polymerase sigma-70 factor (ECF subfamily)
MSDKAHPLDPTPWDVPRAESHREQALEDRIADSSVLAYRVAYGVLRCREDAEDVAQEAFLRAFRCRHDLRDRERFRCWMVRITWRLALNRQRSRRRRERRERIAAGEETRSCSSGESLLVGSESRRRLSRAIEALPEKLRLVLVLSAIEERPIREVATLLDLPEGTVKSRLHLARRRLMEALS